MLVSAIIVLSLTGLMADEWPQWHGPRRDGVWRETGIVERFSGPTLPAVWRTPIGPGYAGPAVAGGKVFVMDRQKEQSTERVHCLDERSGRILWTHEYPCRYRGVSYTSGPRCTPTVDGDRVYTVGTMGHLHCLNVATGAVIWAKDYVKEFGTKVPVWGVASAPLVDGERLISLVGGRDNAMVIAFQKETGAIIWRAVAEQPMGYCPPVIHEAGGARQLIVWVPEEIVSLNPRTGAVYWRHPFHCKQGLSISTPIFDGTHLFVSTVWRGGLMLRLAADRPAASVLWAGTEDTGINPTWGIHCLMSTAYLKKGWLYGVCHYGELRCLHADTGDRFWETLEPTQKDRWSNAFLIPNGDRTFIANEHGELIIARLSLAGYEEISRTKLLAPTTRAGNRRVVWSHPAFANRRVYARNDQEILCAALATEESVKGGR